MLCEWCSKKTNFLKRVKIDDNVTVYLCAKCSKEQHISGQLVLVDKPLSKC